jgi:hypothetical protein
LLANSSTQQAITAPRAAGFVQVRFEDYVIRLTIVNAAIPSNAVSGE